jgi:SP family arabinose:H+ symporter-like MFS transporter
MSSQPAASHADSDASRITPTLLRSTFAASLGGLLFGFDTAVIAGTTGALSGLYQLSPRDLGYTVASALVGTIVGAAFAGAAGDRFGRRDSLRGLAFIYLLSSLGCALAWNWPSLVAFRTVAGLGIGGSSVLGPMYIAEIAPARWRGRLVGMFQLNIVIGILLAYFSNYLIGTGGFGSSEWRVKFGVAAFPAFIFLAMLFAIPRSPRWLVKHGRTTEALQVLEKIGEPRPQEEVEAIIGSLDEEHHRRNEPLFRSEYRLPIFIAVTLGMFNQLTGINAILYYLNDIFARAGFSKMSSDLQAVAIGATNLLFTLVGLSAIDRLGRKKLLLVGAAGMAICLGGVAAVFFGVLGGAMLLPFLILFIGFFALSQGAVIWVYLSEIFPNRVRAKGQSLGSFSHWVMNALISWTFPQMAARSGGYAFLFFAGMTLFGFFVVFAAYPESKGVTLEQMQQEMGIR